MAIQNNIPTRIKLVEVGLNPTATGDMIYDIALKEQLNEFFRSQGKATWDRNHLLTRSEDPEEKIPEDLDKKIAYGRSDLVAEDDGIYAINCEWTPKGEQMIRDGEFEKFSIEVFLNKEKKILGIQRVSLTNDPADPKASLFRMERDNLDVVRTQPKSLQIINSKETVMSKLVAPEVVIDPTLLESLKEDDESEDKPEDVVDDTETKEDDEVEDDKKPEDMEDDSEDEDKPKSELEELKEEVEGLRAMCEELNKQLETYKQAERKEVKTREKSEKEKLLATLNVADSVKKMLQKKSLVEIKQMTRNLNKTSKAIEQKEPEIAELNPTTRINDEEFKRLLKEKTSSGKFSMAQLLVHN